MIQRSWSVPDLLPVAAWGRVWRSHALGGVAAYHAFPQAYAVTSFHPPVKDKILKYHFKNFLPPNR